MARRQLSGKVMVRKRMNYEKKTVIHKALKAGESENVPLLKITGWQMLKNSGDNNTKGNKMRDLKEFQKEMQAKLDEIYSLSEKQETKGTKDEEIPKPEMSNSQSTAIVKWEDR